MIDQTNAVVASFVGESYSVSVQMHIAPGKPPRYTAIARRASDASRAQGWGRDSEDAIEDMQRRFKQGK